jgi:hypothetical protein
MLVVENHGLPIGGLVASAQQAEVKLAEAALATVKVPRPKGGLAAVLRNWGRQRVRQSPVAAPFEKQRDQALPSR